MRIQSSGGREGQRGARTTLGPEDVAICEVEASMEGRVEVQDKKPMTPEMRAACELLCKRVA